MAKQCIFRLPTDPVQIGFSSWSISPVFVQDRHEFGKVLTEHLPRSHFAPVCTVVKCNFFVGVDDLVKLMDKSNPSILDSMVLQNTTLTQASREPAMQLLFSEEYLRIRARCKAVEPKKEG